MKIVVCTPEHEYFVDGVKFDGVTSILRAEGFMPSYVPPDLDWYLERGTMIHHATALWDMGTLDESTVDPRIAGYLESWKKYRQQDGSDVVLLRPDEVEIMLHDLVYQFCGTLDRHWCDIKSGGPERWHIFQIAAYAHLARVNKRHGPDRTVYLDEDGNLPDVQIYKPADLRRAAETFLCALNVHRAKRAMGV